MNNRHINIFFVFMAIIFFAFVFLYHVEGFNTGIYDGPKNFSFDVTPMDLTHTSLVHYRDQWNNSQTIPSHFNRNPNVKSAITKDNFDWRSYIERYAAELKPLGIDTKEKVWEHWTTKGMIQQNWMDELYAHTIRDGSSKDPIMWKDLPFDTSKIETKMNDFTISFWLYLNEVSDTWQPIFKITDTKNPIGRLGVWISPKKTTLHIQQGSSVLPPIGSANTNRDIIIPLKRAIFCTIVFSGKLVKTFVNGSLKGSTSVESLTDATGTNSLEMGYAVSPKKYAIKDFNIYKTSLGDDGAVALYTNLQITNKKVRYVRIQHYVVHVQEVEVFNEKGVNVAKTSTPRASSIAHNGSPAYVTDGNKYNGQGWPNSNHTGFGGNQFLELDLNSNEDVKQVIVYNRPDCGVCFERLAGATLSLLDDKRYVVADKILLTKELVQTYNIKTYSSSDEAWSFFNGSTENFTSMPLKKWSFFGSGTEAFTTSSTLPDEIKLANGTTFNFYDHKASHMEAKIMNLGEIYDKGHENKLMYYYDFKKSNQDHINIPHNILYEKSGCTFACWFYNDPAVVSWSRIFDFGGGPGNHNIVLAILHGVLQFYVFHGNNPYKFESRLPGVGNNWYHVAWTMDPAGNDNYYGQWKIYINGNLEHTTGYDKILPIAYENTPDGGTTTFTGSIEEVKTVESFRGFFQRKKDNQRDRIEEQKRIAQQKINQIRAQQERTRQQHQKKLDLIRRNRERRERKRLEQERMKKLLSQKFSQLKQAKAVVKPAPAVPQGLTTYVPKVTTVTVKSPMPEFFQVEKGKHEFIISDLKNRKIQYTTTNISVGVNTRVTVYSEVNLQGSSLTFDNPSAIGNITDNFTVKSMKLEKIIKTQRVVRKNQYIGRSNWGHDDFYNGSIGDFRIFDKVLDKDQIKYIYYNPKTLTN